MNYIRITKENIDKEHICCAMSGKQSVAKKEWLRQRFDDGLVFYRSEERGKCFIEYIPAENAWVPIEADGYLYINCLWVSGSMKGHGYSNDLLEACIRDPAVGYVCHTETLISKEFRVSEEFPLSALRAQNANTFLSLRLGITDTCLQQIIRVSVSLHGAGYP